jgi:signal transduction histidine kinase
MTSSSFLRLYLTMLCLVSGASAQDAALTRIGEVRALSAAEAEKGRTVRLRGVVTQVTGNALLFFLQDESGGVAVSGPRERPVRADFKAGALVEVEGVTAVEHGAVYVTARKKEPLRLAVVGEGALPEPRAATLGDLARPEFQGVRVEISGVVRAVRKEPFGNNAQETLLLTLVDESDRVVAALPGRSAAALPTQLVGATVRVRGVFNAVALERQPGFTNRLLLNAQRDVTVVQAAPAPFKRAPVPIAAARESADDPGIIERLHVQGRVTAVVPGRGMFVEDANGGIFVEAEIAAAVGAGVSVAGFPVLRDGAPVLEDAVWREAKLEEKIVPPLVTAEVAMSGVHDGRLVQIEALLLTLSGAGEGPTLVLQSGARVFLARCANPKLRLPPLGEHSWLRLTGVCVNPHAPQLREAGAERGASFYLLMPGPQAIEIAGAPNWWTFRRVMIAGAVLGGLALAAVAWATTLRRRVAQQTAQIREHLHREAVAEERLRIAGELHDSVQQDLLGITMQIKATERLLDTAPEKARAALGVASAMVRHSQAETHRAVWDLRESAEDHADLVSALEAMIAGLTTDDGPKMELTCTGERRALPAALETQVLRVAQEAASNALKHAAASRLALELRFAPDRLTLLVCDDGRGFDAELPPSAAHGHFGLFGMQERAVKLGADLRVTSRSGAGTTITLDVPIPAPEPAPPAPIASGLRLLARPSTS